MKKWNLAVLLTAGCTAAGLLGMAARKWLLTGADNKGLLAVGHAGSVISWVLTALVILALVAVMLQKNPRCRFAEGPLALACHVLQAVALVIAAFRLFGAGSGLHRLTAIAALAAAVCSLAIPVCKFLSRNIPLLRCPLALFYLMFMVCCYQGWSREPELQRYVFQLLALVCLTLAAYQRAALDMDLGSGRMYLFAANAGLFFCLAAVPGAPYPLFFLLMAAAFVLDGCTVTEKRRT